MSDRVWKGVGQPSGRILFGRLGEENPNHPGTYRFSSEDGFIVNDAHILSPDLDAKGRGQRNRPAAGAFCIAVMSHSGAGCFIIGFQAVPSWDEQSDDPPAVGNADDNQTSEDKVFRTSGGAALILKRGGGVIIEGGAGTGVILNPLNNTMTLRAANYNQIADGYSASRGRKQPGKTDPATLHDESFQHQVGPSFDRVEISHGSVNEKARRQLTIEAVTVAGSNQTAIAKTRETYNSDGSWVGEGPKYQWGGDGADEPVPLGNQLVTKLGELIDIVKSLKVNTAWGPSTPPLPDTILKLVQLKSELSDAILSKYLFVSKKPKTLT